MMTSCKKIQRTEAYLFRQLHTEDRLFFEAQLLIDPVLRENTFFQKKAYYFVTLFNRRKVKRNMEAIHDRIFNDPTKVDFQQNILKFFNP